jgi:hypothetical protein
MCSTCADLGIPLRCTQCSTPICLQPDPECAGTSLASDVAVPHRTTGDWLCGDCAFFADTEAIAGKLLPDVEPYYRPAPPQLRLV